MTFEQINFDFPGGFKMENTNWGGLDADSLLLTEMTGIPIGYINVFGDAGWLVQNLSLDVNDSIEKLSTYFTLFSSFKEIILENQPLPIEAFNALVTYSDEPLSVAPTNCPKIGFPY